MFDKFIANKTLGGINCLIWQDGQILLQESYGYQNPETKTLMSSDALFRISSMTKPITSVLAMMLSEEQKLNLSDPITKWFPRFSKMKVLKDNQTGYEAANRPITVLDLLTHRAGFTYGEFQQGKLRKDYAVLGGDIDSHLSREQWISELAKLPLVSQPGELFNYGRSTDLLGILISAIEEKPLGEVMSEKLFTPLAMTDTFFDVPEAKQGRCVSNFGYDDLGNPVTLETVPLGMALKERPANLDFQSGGQGLWSTLEDYLKFARIFVEGGSPNGIRILKPETVALMRTNHLTAYQKEHSKLMGTPIFRDQYGFGLGLAVVTKENAFGSIPCAGSVGSVGWPGAYGGWWSADPAQKAIAIFLTHSMASPGQLAQGIGFDLYEAIDIFAGFARGLIN